MINNAWLNRQRPSVQAVAAHLSRLGYADEIVPTLDRAEEREAARHEFINEQRQGFVRRRDEEALLEQRTS